MKDILIKTNEIADAVEKATNISLDFYTTCFMTEVRVEEQNPFSQELETIIYRMRHHGKAFRKNGVPEH